VRLVQATELKF